MPIAKLVKVDTIVDVVIGDEGVPFTELIKYPN